MGEVGLGAGRSDLVLVVLARRRLRTCALIYYDMPRATVLEVVVCDLKRISRGADLRVGGLVQVRPPVDAATAIHR